MSRIRGAVAAATWFESLAVASRPLQRRTRRNNLYFTTKNTKLREISNQENRSPDSPWREPRKWDFRDKR